MRCNRASENGRADKQAARCVSVTAHRSTLVCLVTQPVDASDRVQALL